MDGATTGGAESVHSPVVHAHISHAVIAAYVVDAVLAVPGVHALVGSTFGSRERRLDADRSARGVRVSPAGPQAGTVDLDLRLIVAAEAAAGTVAEAVDRAVRDYLTSMIAIEVAAVTVVVEGVAEPAAHAA